MSSDSQRNCHGARKAVQESISHVRCWRRSVCGTASSCLPERDDVWKRSLWHISSVCNFQDFLGPQWPCRWETLWWVERIACTISAPWPLWVPATKYSTSGWYRTCRTHNSSGVRHQPKGALDLAFCWGADYSLLISHLPFTRCSSDKAASSSQPTTPPAHGHYGLCLIFMLS